MKILAISGSLRKDSHNTKLLRAAVHALPPQDLESNGIEVEVFDGVADLPHYSEDLDVRPAPDAVTKLREAVSEADAVLISTPEYNSSIPGTLKNALDWASRPFPENAFRSKPVAVIGASAGIFGAVWAQAEARKVLGAIGARVVDEELPVGHAHEAFDDYGVLAEEGLRQKYSGILSGLVEYARQEDAVTA